MSQREFGYGTISNQNTGSSARQTPYHDDPFGFNGEPRSGSGYGSYNELVDKISSSIFQINNNATTLQGALKQIGTNKDNFQLRDRIHDTEKSTNKIINDTAVRFKHLSNVCNRSERAQKLQYDRLFSEFREMLERYNSLQKEVAGRAKSAILKPTEQTPRTDLINWEDAAADDEARLLEEEQRQQQLMAQEQVIESDLAFIEEREERIRQLEGDILDINEIFRDLGTLVHEQGETIDTIESNVERVYDDVDAGNVHLSKAASYQKKARKKMCILVTILLVIAAIITIIIVVSIKK